MRAQQLVSPESIILVCIIIIVIAVGGGHDYTFEPYSITFTAGVTIALVNVTIVDNNNCDNNKTFILTINSYAYSLLTSNVIVGDPSDTKVTILDDGECNYMGGCVQWVGEESTIYWKIFEVQNFEDASFWSFLRMNFQGLFMLITTNKNGKGVMR